MDQHLRDWIERVRHSFGDQCFACGRDNPIGLHLDEWDWSGDAASAVFRPVPEHRGAGSTLHGGLATTVLDEAMVWAGIFAEKVLTVTGTLHVRFVKPLYTTDTIEAVGRVDERRGRRLKLSGTLSAGDGVAAQARGLYIVSETVDEPSSTSR